MEEKIAYFVINNPFCKEISKRKYDFVFYYSNNQYNLNRQYRFCVRENETVNDLRKKIASFIDTSLRLTQESKESESGEKENKTVYLPKSEVIFLQNNEEINRKMQLKTFENIKNKIIFKILDQSYKVLINTPQIINLELPTSLFVGYPVYPSIFETVLVDTQLSEYFWYKSNDKNNWVYISGSLSYTPTNEDLNKYLKLKCVPKFKAKSGNEIEANSSERIVRFPHQDVPFENRHKLTTIKYSGKKIISYNVLANHYVKNQYPYCAEYALNIDYRRQLILRELIGYNADLICLQETDYKSYKNFYREELSKLGYKSYFDPKQGISEGLSLFYKSSRFTVLRKFSIIIGKEIQNNRCMSSLWNKVKNNEDVAKKLIIQNTVLQVVVFRSNNKINEILVVANTHLYYHPDARHIRLLQIGVCDMYIQDVINQITKKFPKDRISFIFCGDFNSQPDTGVFEFFVNGHVSQNAKDWRQNPNEVVKNISLRQIKSLESAYKAHQFTNYTEEFKGCLDYIFYETKFLNLKQIIPLFSEEELSKHTALPSIVVPSDHIALIADFSWK